jgi:hypothetical protein
MAKSLLSSFGNDHSDWRCMAALRDLGGEKTTPWSIARSLPRQRLLLARERKRITSVAVFKHAIFKEGV